MDSLFLLFFSCHSLFLFVFNTNCFQRDSESICLVAGASVTLADEYESKGGIIFGRRQQKKAKEEYIYLRAGLGHRDHWNLDDLDSFPIAREAFTGEPWK